MQSVVPVVADQCNLGGSASQKSYRTWLNPGEQLSIVAALGTKRKERGGRSDGLAMGWYTVYVGHNVGVPGPLLSAGISP